MSQNIDQQCNEYIDYHRNRGYNEITFQQLDVVISAREGRAVRTRLICPNSQVTHMPAFIFISPDYGYYRSSLLRQIPVTESQEFVDMRGNVLHTVEVWDLERNDPYLELEAPDGFWVQRAIRKANFAAGDDFSYEYEFICARSPSPRAREFMNRL